MFALLGENRGLEKMLSPDVHCKFVVSLAYIAVAGQEAAGICTMVLLLTVKFN